MAYAELIHVQKQIKDALQVRNITDPIEQKKRIIKDFGVDVLEITHEFYMQRPDHINIVNHFIPLEVQKITAEILENHYSYLAVAQEFNKVADQVLDNAKLCELECVPQVEDQILDSLQIIQEPKNNAEFIFHTTIVDHLLTDLQSQSTAVVEGKPINWEYTSEVLIHGLTKFILRLNPITQAKDIASLFGHGIQFLANRVQEIATDPITVTKNSIETTTTVINFIVDIARFTSDITTGFYYLSTQEGQQRIGTFCKSIVQLGKASEAVTAKDVAGGVGEIVGDFVFSLGVSSAAVFLKEIDAFDKISKEAKVIAQGLKSAIEEHPSFATTDGMVLKMSDGMKDAGGAVKGSANVLAQPVITDATQSVKGILAAEAEYTASQAALNQEKKVINNVVQEVAKTNSTAGKLKSFPTFEDAKNHIFSKNHKNNGIMDLGPTEEAIMKKFVEIIKEADVKNLLEKGPNNIVTKINGKEVTIRVFVENSDVVRSYDGFIGLSNRKVDKTIYL